MKTSISKTTIIASLIGVLCACNSGNEYALDTQKKTLALISSVSLAEADQVTEIVQGTVVPLNPLMSPQTARRYDATVLSADGTSIAFTVYAPNIPVGNSAPLLLHSHGWTGKRSRDINTQTYDSLPDVTLKTAKLAMDMGVQGGKVPGKGWYVISYDQRGHGDSGGYANVMDPEIEGKDLKAIIDWAQSNLPGLAHRKNSGGVLDPIIGAVGASYGGGFQTIGAGVDKRIDAIVPFITWHDLRYSLFSPPKSIYLNTFAATPAFLVRIEPFLYQSIAEANLNNEISADLLRKFYLHSPISYCEGNSPSMQNPRIPAFYIQGSNDILFNLNEGIKNFQCFRQENSNTKFMATRFGHFNPLVNPTQAMEANAMETNVACNNLSIPIPKLTFSFLSQNLIDSRLDDRYSPDYLTVPDLRAVLEDGNPSSGPNRETAEGKCFEVARLGTGAGNATTIQTGGVATGASPGTIFNFYVGLPALLQGLAVSPELLTPSSPLGALVGPEAAKTVTLLQPAGFDRKRPVIPS